MNRIRLFTFVAFASFVLLVPVSILAQTPTPTPMTWWQSFIAWVKWFEHTPFNVAGWTALLPVLAVDYQAFKAFQTIQEAVKFDYRTMLFRAAQAYLLGGVAGTILKGMVGAALTAIHG